MKYCIMTYFLPEGISSAQELEFLNPVNPIKNPTRAKGFLIPVKGSTPVLGFKVKKWANGSSNDKKAKWRKGRGLGHGRVSTKFKAKIKGE